MDNTLAVDEMQPHRLTADCVVTALGTDARIGLTQTRARERLQRYGRNELAAGTAVPRWRIFLSQFTSWLVILLIFAASVSAVLWLYERDSPLPYEAIAIFVIVILNALLGYVQQARAQQALAALQQMSAAHANVIRDGTRQSIPATELVPGDILLVEEGNFFGADARLVASIALQTAEAALTGESVPVSKNVAVITGEAAIGDRRNMIFRGTTATFGHGRAVVTATGMNTEMGHIAGLLKDVPDEITPLQKELDRVGKLLGVTVVVIAIVMIATILLVQNVRGASAIFDVLILGVALAVAAVPEGLPAIVTAVLSLGVQRMVKRNAIVRHLAAVETLGSASVIATDKTGTLTKNAMTVRVVVTASGRVALTGTGYDPEGELRGYEGDSKKGPIPSEVLRLLAAADRASNAVVEKRDGQWSVQGDPTEGALIVAARKAGLRAEVLDARFSRIAELPFSSERRMMSTLQSDVESQNDLFILAKGAPGTLLERCSQELVGREMRSLSPSRRAEILTTNEGLAGEALRTLGVAFRQLPNAGLEIDVFDESMERDLVFIGLIGMIDPPREEARDAVARAKAAGIRSIMITGDHPTTGAVIAAELGISASGPAVSGAELGRMSDEELNQTVRERSVYARVDPSHKLQIVKALQRQGMTVAMTGDGVNDAPALKVADIGIAMGITGTDVSKEAADMVLADDNFATIVAAVEEGRTIFSNIRKFLRYLLSSNIGEVLTMFFGVLLAGVLGLTAGENSGVVVPLLATQILWINLVTDGAPALALGVEPPESGAMDKPPRPKGEGVITRRMWAGIFLVGAIMAVGTLTILDASLPGGLIEGPGPLRYGQTMAFTTLMLFQLFNVFNARSDERSAFHGLFTNRWLWPAIALALILHVAVVYIPLLQEAFSTTNLNLGDWLCCAAVASSVLWLSELGKIATRTTK